MSKQLREKYKVLAGLMNDKSLMKVSVVSGLIDCYEIMMTEEECDFLLSLGSKVIKKESLRPLSPLNDEDYEEFIHSALNKGMIWLTYKEDGVYAELAPIFPGWIEVSLSNGGETDKQLALARKFASLLQLKRKVNILPLRKYFNYKYENKKKTEIAPISIATAGGNRSKKNIVLDKEVQSAENVIIIANEVYDILDRLPKDYPIAVITCFCRFLHRQVGETCRFNLPEQACIQIGSFAKQMVEYEVGRYITIDEAREIVKECESKGAFHNIFHYGMNTENPVISICNCCWDCCCLHGVFNRGGLSPMFLKAHYKPIIKDESKCTKCNKCNSFCPANCTGVKDGELFLDDTHCIGCGQCAYQCPNDVREMIHEERKVFVPSLSKDRVRIKKKYEL